MDGASTDAWVYLVIGGREFCLDPGSGNGYVDQGAKTCFVLGKQGGADDGEGGFTSHTRGEPRTSWPKAPR